jgi:SAM-dependent methyltransferase
VCAHGSFDRIELQDSALTVQGWMMLPGAAFDRLIVYINGAEAARATPVERADLGTVFPTVPHAAVAGFRFSVALTPEHTEGMIDIRVAGVSGGRETAVLETWYRSGIESLLPVPPLDLMKRVTIYTCFYITGGLHSYRDFWSAIRRHADPATLGAVLDWGCGCGRLTRHFISFSGIPRICGCDIDAGAIAWCAENLAPAQFATVPLHPPAPYEDDSFDAVVAYSVLTHLTRDVQREWIKEMRRILKPGGLFLASVHGESAAFVSFNKEAPKILADGICDSFHGGPQLDGIAPPGYYRGTFQAKRYTLREYSRIFEILEYRERGATNFQDLVVMRKH